MSEIKNRELFENVPVAHAVSKMAVPAITGQLIILIYNMADTFFIGLTNNPFMVASASLILPVFNITISIACMAGVGGGALISRLLGEHQEDEAKKVCSFSIYFSATLAILFAADVLLFMRPLLGVLGTRFLRIRCLATILMFASFYHVHLFNSYGKGKYALLPGVARWAVFNIPMLFIINRVVGMYGLVWSQLLADILTVALSIAVHQRFVRKNFPRISQL